MEIAGGLVILFALCSVTRLGGLVCSCWVDCLCCLSDLRFSLLYYKSVVWLLVADCGVALCMFDVGLVVYFVYYLVIVVIFLICCLR